MLKYQKTKKAQSMGETESKNSIKETDYRRLKIKLSLIGIFVLFSLFSFQEQFIKSLETLYHFDNMRFAVVMLTFGVILTASIYNLAFYFYIRNKQYLYYGLAQLSTLLMLISLDSIFISPFYEVFGFKSHFVLDLSKAFVVLFSMFFIREFLKSYPMDERIRSLINAIIYITAFDIVLCLILSYSVFTTLIPIFIPIWLVLSEAYRLIEEKDTPFYFLITGWYITIGVSIMMFVGFIKMTGIVFPFIHLSFAIESIFLSLAISYKFKLVEEKQKMQQALLLQQSRLASMGEMISIIAHQWRQPLNFLSVVNMNLNRMHKDNKNSKMLLSEANKQIEYMSETINSFRNFYNPSKSKEEFSIKEASQHAINIVSHSMQSHKIEMIEIFEEDSRVYGNRNEFEQVVLNLLNNAKDAIIERKIESSLIEVRVGDGGLSVRDNAGGIKKRNLERIFNPYFSTKKDSDGIGLYISKLIIEQEMGGRLDVSVYEGGSVFEIRF